MSKDTYEARVKRVETAIALGTPDRGHCLPLAQTYPMIHAGYTVAECIYDVDKGIDAFLRYMREYEPDQAPGMQYNNLGMFPLFFQRRSGHLHDGPVVFLHTAARERGVEESKGSVAAGKENAAGNGNIQAVDRSKTALGGSRGELFL